MRGRDLEERSSRGGECVLNLFPAPNQTWPTLHPPLTITAPLNVSDPVQGVGDEVRESAIEVHGGQAALEAVPRGH